MSFRKENKFRLTVSDMKLLKSELISKGMAELYPEREVKSKRFWINLSRQIFCTNVYCSKKRRYS